MKKILNTSCATFVLMAAHAAHANTIDYGGLQDLFNEPVTTSATGKPQRASEAPVAMDIISSDDIRRSGAESIPQLLGRVTGLVNWQSTRAWSDVGVRGQNTTFNPTLLVLVNGRQVYIDTYGYTDWSLIPVQMEEIRQIEVVKGPNTALFGFNAVSGVVNIVTYNPKYDKVSEAGATIGTNNYGKILGVHTMKLSDSLNVRVSGDLKSEDEFSAHSKTSFASLAGPIQSTDRLGHFNLDSIAQLTEQTQFRLEGSHAETDINENGFYNVTQASSRTSSAKASLITQTNYGLVEGSIYQNRFSWAPSVGAAATNLSTDNSVTVAQLQDLFKVGTDHTFRILGEYRYNEATGPNIIGPGATFSYNQGALSSMWNWAITPRLEMTNALRVDSLAFNRDGPANGVPFNSNDDYAKTNTTLGANSGLVWKATDDDTLRLSYARGILMPTLYPASTYIALSGIVLTGDPRLSPAVVNDYEFGYDRSLAAIDGKFRGSIYYKKTEDVFAGTSRFYVSGGTPVFQTSSIGNSSTAGLELKLNGKIASDWAWDLGYAYQTTDDDFRLNGVSSIALNYEDTFPNHIVNAHLGWANGPWEADLYGQATSDFQTITSPSSLTYALVDMDGYQTLGSRVAYRFENDMTVAISGSQLTQTRLANSPGLEEERQVFLSLSQKF